MGSPDGYENGVVSRELENVRYSIIYLHFQMEATPHLFYKSLDGNENRRSSVNINGIVICVANKAHAKIIGIIARYRT